MKALIANNKVAETPSENEKNQPKGEGMKDADDSPTTKKERGKKKKEKGKKKNAPCGEKSAVVKKETTMNLNHTKPEININITNNNNTTKNTTNNTTNNKHA